MKIHDYIYPTQALQDVQCERVKQDAKWGEQNRCPTAWITIVTEELGEAAKHALTLDLVEQTPEETAKYRQEMVECAAVAVAAIEAIDRGKWTPCELRSLNEGRPEN